MNIRMTCEGRDGLTPGKLYRAAQITQHMVEIRDDFGDLLICAIGRPCAHLAYQGQWEIVNELSPDDWER